MSSPARTISATPTGASHVTSVEPEATHTMHRPRRRTNSLGADPRGDTNVPTLATLDSTIVRHHNQKWRSHSKRKRARSVLQHYTHNCSKHTWLLPLTILIVLLSLYLVNPTQSNPLHSCIFLSYQLPNASPGTRTQYDKGVADFAFVAFYIVVLSFTREFFTQRVIRPWAIYCGIHKRAKQYRFMEQVYTAMYFGISGPIGLYIMYNTSIWYFDTDAMWIGYPHKTHDAWFKAYYLVQASYWAQQAIVLLLMLERPRKDFRELVLHHIITIALIWCSYRFHFTYIGIAVYITHDISDFFLATSKTLNYLDSPITAPYFALFVGIWIYMRHYLNLKLLYAVLFSFNKFEPTTLNWETQEYKCWISHALMSGLLAVLQSINLFWLYLIFRIMKRVITSSHLNDVRSDDESEDELVDDKTSRSPDRSLDGAGQKDTVGFSRPRVLLNGSPVDEDAAIARKKQSLKKRRKS